MSRVWTGLLDLLFPRKCPFCRALLRKEEEGLCALCQERLPWLTGGEAERRGEFYAVCASPLRYQGAVRESFHRYKFGGALSYARVYGRLMAQCARDHLGGPWDCVSWAPLSKRRRGKRGYDQAELLARAMAGELGATAVGLLEKTRHNGAQSGLKDDGARRANVLGAYRMRGETDVKGARVLLVDDIVTTGATLSECARVLRTAGAGEVFCVTFARARE